MVLPVPGVFIDPDSTSIDLRPLKELADNHPHLLNRIDLGGIDPNVILKMDEDGDGRLTISEYLQNFDSAFLSLVEHSMSGRSSTGYHCFQRLDTRLQQIYADASSRDIFPETMEMTSREACGYFKNLVDDRSTAVIDATGLFFCRGTDLIDATTSVAASGNYVTFEESPAGSLCQQTTFDTVLSFVPEDRRAGVILDGLHSPNPEVRKAYVDLIEFAPLDTRFHLYKTAFNYKSPLTYDNDVEMQQAVMKDIYYLEDAGQRHHMVWAGLNSGYPETIKSAIEQFHRLPKPWRAGAILHVLTSNYDADMRKSAVEQIEYVPVAEQRILIEKALLDENVNVNLAAVSKLRPSLYRFSHQPNDLRGDSWFPGDYGWAVDTFRIALKDRHPQVFEAAFEALLDVVSSGDQQLFTAALSANPNFPAALEKKKALIAAVDKDKEKFGFDEDAYANNNITRDDYYLLRNLVSAFEGKKKKEND